MCKNNLLKVTYGITFLIFDVCLHKPIFSGDFMQLKSFGLQKYAFYLL